MKKIRVEVKRTDTYVVEIDESIYNEEWYDDFKKHFHDIADHTDVVSDPDENLKNAILEGIAIDLSQQQARLGSDTSSGFIEGFGYVTRDGEVPFGREDYENGELLPPEKRRKPAPGLNIIIESEDFDIEFEIETLNNKES